MSPAVKAARKLELQNFLTGTGRVRKTEEPEKQQRFTNKLYALGLDHALQIACDIGLANFLPQNPQELQKLHIDHTAEDPQELQEVHIDDKAEDTDSSSSTSSTDSDSDSDRETEDTQAQHQIHIVCDRGMAGWQMWFWYFGALHAHGSFQWDEPHKDWTDVNAALDLAGLKAFRLGLTALLNLSSGPYLGAAMLDNTSNTAKVFFANSDFRDELLGRHSPFMHQ